MRDNGNSAPNGSLMGLSAAAATGCVESASWLSDDILLLTGWFSVEFEYPLEVCLISGDQAVPLEVRSISYTKSDNGSEVPRTSRVITARFLRSEDVEGNLGRLLIKNGGSIFSPLPFELSEVVTDLQSHIQGSFTELEIENRGKVLAFLASTLEGHLGTTNSARLSKNLFSIREALRKPLPQFDVVPENPRNIYVETLVSIDETSFYIQGWMRDPEGKIKQVTAVSPEGNRIELTNELFHYSRPDVEGYFRVTSEAELKVKNAFICYFETDLPSFLSRGWLVEMKGADGFAMQVTVPTIVRDPVNDIEKILTEIQVEPQLNEELLLHHIHPALARLQQKRQEKTAVESIEQYGTPALSPEVSIVIPLYKRIDFLEHQLAQFVHDPEFSKNDLIYILDSPEQAGALREMAIHLAQLYNVPFRIVTLKENFGYSTANNVGASMARGRLLLLLNSDVLPDKPGWLGAMTGFYNSMPGIGALGPKLLFEDDTLQHAGLYFERLDDSPLWTNQHYFKGYHRDLPAANWPRAVPGVTGACMMVATDLYKGLGGLGGNYIQGDYEDSDFCLRLIASGRKNWYLPHVELYHLEGQSYPAPLRHLTWKFNAWMHASLWGDLIEEVMSIYPTRFEAAPAHPAEIRPLHFAAMPVLGRSGSSSGQPARRPGLIRTNRSDLVDLYLQTCARTSRLSDRSDSRIWIMSESGSMVSYPSDLGGPDLQPEWAHPKGSTNLR